MQMPGLMKYAIHQSRVEPAEPTTTTTTDCMKRTNNVQPQAETQYQRCPSTSSQILKTILKTKSFTALNTSENRKTRHELKILKSHVNELSHTFHVSANKAPDEHDEFMRDGNT